MVTSIKNAKANNAKQDETRQGMMQRGIALIDKAIKGRIDSLPDMYAAYAVAVYYAVKEGDLSLVNRLYNGLPQVDREGMRIFAMPELAARFDAGAQSFIDDKGNERWSERPVNIFAFTAKPKNEGKHWSLVSTKENADPAKVERIKATKAAILAAGETALTFEWVRPSVAGRVTNDAYTAGSFIKDMIRLLKKAAAHGPTIDRTPEELRRICNAVGLDASSTMAVLDAWPKVQTPKPVPANAESETPEEKPEETDNREAKAA